MPMKHSAMAYTSLYAIDYENVTYNYGGKRLCLEILVGGGARLDYSNILGSKRTAQIPTSVQVYNLATAIWCYARD